MNIIPKKIHYCWFGGNPKSEKILRCMESWKKHLQDYEIIEWSESNCDIAGSMFAKCAYESKMWAFVADYFRFKVLYEHGGVYLDTDVLVHKPFDGLLQYSAFFPMESYEEVNATTCGAEPKSEVIKKMLDKYADRKPREDEGTVCKTVTQVLADEYGYQPTGYTQHLKGNIAVLSPNILMVDVGDGKSCCEHLFDANVSWWEGELISAMEGQTWKYAVLFKYFYNELGRPPYGRKIFRSDGGALEARAETISALLEETAPLMEQIDELPIKTASELYGMYGEAANIAASSMPDIDTELRVRLCSRQDEILERIVDDMPPLCTGGYKNVYAPAVKGYDRWVNAELMGNPGLAVFMLGKELGMRPFMLFGKSSEDFPYLDSLPGMEVLRTDEAPGNMGVYYEHLAENYRQMDVLALNGFYPRMLDYLDMYRKLRPDGRVYLALDMNRHHMGKIPWGGELVKKATSQCDIIATSCRNARDALNLNPHVSFPCRWLAYGFYNPDDSRCVADPGVKENIILTAGQIGTADKNDMELMAAFAIAAEALPGWSLRLVGGIDPEFLPAIDSFYEKCPELKDRVVFTGAVTDKAELYKEYARAKIFALASRAGGFPDEYAQALFHGCMFATSDVDASEDMTKSGELGMTYRLGDTAALADSLIKLASIADRQAFDKHVPRALAYAKRYYDWGRNAKKLAYMMFG